jgi:hypothetical protein
MRVKRAAKAIAVTAGPAVVLGLILYSTGRLGFLAQTKAQPPVAVGTEAEVPFAEAQLEATQDERPAIKLQGKRRLALAPMSLSALEVVGDDLVVAAKGPLMAVNMTRFLKSDVRYLAPKDADYAQFTLRTVTDLQPDGPSRVWVFDYYGMATLWDTKQVRAPLRTVHSLDGNLGAAWSDGRLFVHQPGGNANISVLELDGGRGKGAKLVDGACCASLDVETTKMTRAIGPPPFGRLNFGLAIWLGRGSLTSSPSGGIALAFLLDSRLHFYDSNGLLKASTAGPRAHPLDFLTKRAADGSPRIDFVPNKETRFTHISVTSNSRRVYVLVAGEPFGAVGAARVFTGTEVHAYGWDGQLQTTIQLPEAVGRIAVSEDGRRLYGTSGSDVVEFQLDEDVRGPRYSPAAFWNSSSEFSARISTY